jgi:hypothetical protein
MNAKLKRIENRIKIIKKTLLDIEEMRPGSLSQQQRKSRKNESYGTYWSLNYTFKNKRHTEYIRNELVDEIEPQVEMYKKFKMLVDEWIELSIEYGREKLKNSRQDLEK